MTPRFQRFTASSSKVLAKSDFSSVVSKMEEDLPSIDSIMNEEKSASPAYADAWARAEELYESKIKASLLPKDVKVINETMPEKLPLPLKQNPCHVPIAVIVFTQEDHQEFVTEFNEATFKLMESSDWSSFNFKSLLMLLTLAQRHLPSRPNQELKRVIFRSASTEWEVKKDETISFGHFTSFTPRRFVAMGMKKDDDAAGDEEEDHEGETPPSSTRPTLVKMTFTSSVHGLGVKHLSPLGEDEREVIVTPLQSFKVTEVLHRKKKGFSVVSLAPVEP